jgi:hypothetical protein
VVAVEEAAVQVQFVVVLQAVPVVWTEVKDAAPMVQEL